MQAYDAGYLTVHPGSITCVVLNRPEKHNAFDATFIGTFTEILESIHDDPQVRVVLVTAKGESFCAGADLHWMRETIHYSRAKNIADALRLSKLMQVLHDLSKPTIALVQGNAFGGGVGLVACCDIAIASNQANFCLSEVKLGLIPATVAPYLIAAIGKRPAQRYLLTGESFTAKTALQLGLLHQVVSPRDLQKTGQHYAELFLHNGPQALTQTKRLIQRCSFPIDKPLIQATAQWIAQLRVSSEGQEGLNAFLAKRTPTWV